MSNPENRLTAVAVGTLGFLALRTMLPGGTTPVAFALVGAAWTAALVLVAARPEGVVAFAAGGALGASSAAAFFVEPVAWTTGTAVALAAALAVPSSRRALLSSVGACALPPGLALVTAFSAPEAGNLAREGLSRALRDLPSVLLHVAVLAPAFFLFAEWFRARRPDDESRPRARLAGAFAAVALLGIAAARVHRTWLLVRSPSDVHEWSEPALLADVLALVHHVPLYRPFELVASYTYSPGVPLLHLAVLAPLGLATTATAHHALTFVLDVATAGLAGAALARNERGGPLWRAALAAMGSLATFSVLAASPAAGGMHPDHVLHLGVVATAAFLLRDPSPIVRTKAATAFVVLVPPLLVAFKLTAVGVWVGLGLALLLGERRREWALPLVLSAALSLATIPLFDALFGSFSAYALGLMTKHAVFPSRLPSALLSGVGLVSGLAVFASLRGRPNPSPAVRRVGLFALGVLVTTLPAYLKEGGAWNNLIASALPASLALLALAARYGDAERRGAVVVSTATLVAAAIHPTTGFGKEDLEAARSDHEIAVRALRADVRAGRTPLSLGSTAAFLDAGLPGVPEDLGTSAVELFMAREPAFERHLERVASGRYATIVAEGRFFVAMSSVKVPFAGRYRQAVEGRYCVVNPRSSDGAPAPLTLGERLLVLRRRDLGCAPFW
ncbi:MAG TPA: hypothetical protein VHE30_30200 [Polyangiaceae bacterium]|nr:hypothetical protein [Polyangiaceae bacterium]